MQKVSQTDYQTTNFWWKILKEKELNQEVGFTVKHEILVYL